MRMGIKINQGPQQVQARKGAIWEDLIFGAIVVAVVVGLIMGVR